MRTRNCYMLRRKPSRIELKPEEVRSVLKEAASNGTNSHTGAPPVSSTDAAFVSGRRQGDGAAAQTVQERSARTDS